MQASAFVVMASAFVVRTTWWGVHQWRGKARVGASGPI